MRKTNSDHNYIRKYANAVRVINLLGGKCTKCGNVNISHLQFHHINSKTKEYAVNKLTSSQYNNLLKEAKKCILLCANCHYEFHFNEKLKKYNPFNRASTNKKTFLKAINKFECEECGYNSCYDALDFHHKIPQSKKIVLGGINKRFSSVGKLTEAIIEELDKCQVLCKNCHSSKHFDNIKFDSYKNEIYKKVENYRQNNINIDTSLINKLHNEGKTWKEISIIANVSIASISKYLKDGTEVGSSN